MDSYTRVIHKHVKILIIVVLVGYAALLAVQLIVEFMEEEPQFSVGTNAPMAKMEITIKDAGIRLGDCPPSCNGKCAGKHQEPSDVMVVGNGTIGQEISKPLCIICGEEHGSDDHACIQMSDNVGIGSCRPRHSDEPHDCAIPTQKLDVVRYDVVRYDRTLSIDPNHDIVFFGTNSNAEIMHTEEPYTNFVFTVLSEGYTLTVIGNDFTNRYVILDGEIVPADKGEL